MTPMLAFLAVTSLGLQAPSPCDRPASDRQVFTGEAQTDAARMEQIAREALRLCPANAKAHNLLGNALEMKGDLAGAQQAYLASSRLEGGWYLPVLGQADVARKRGSADTARTLYKSARALAATDEERAQVDQSSALMDPKAGQAYSFKSAETLSRSFRIGEKLTQVAASPDASSTGSASTGAIGMPGAVVRDSNTAASVSAPRGSTVLGDGMYQMNDGTVVAHLSITYFVNSTRMTAEGIEQAKQVAAALSRVTGGERFTIEGHASSEGDPARNLTLSEERAKALRDYLVAAGVPSGVFEVRGFGSSNPVVEDGAENKPKSRRATLVRRQ